MATRKQTAPHKRHVHEDLYDQPGHLIRRAHQIALGMFADHVGDRVTPVQYAILRMVHEAPGLDQVSLARRVGLDNSTTATTCARLEAKGLITRAVVEGNRRQLRLELTAEGQSLLFHLVTGVHAMRESLLGSLTPTEQAQFIRLLRKFVQLNNDQSRAPLDASGPSGNTAA